MLRYLFRFGLIAFVVLCIWLAVQASVHGWGQESVTDAAIRYRQSQDCPPEMRDSLGRCKRAFRGGAGARAATRGLRGGK